MKEKIMKLRKTDNELPELNEDVLVTDGRLYAVAHFDGSHWNPSNVEPTYDMSNVVLDMGLVTHWGCLSELTTILKNEEGNLS